MSQSHFSIETATSNIMLILGATFHPMWGQVSFSSSFYLHKVCKDLCEYTRLKAVVLHPSLQCGWKDMETVLKEVIVTMWSTCKPDLKCFFTVSDDHFMSLVLCFGNAFICFGVKTLLNFLSKYIFSFCIWLSFLLVWRSSFSKILRRTSLF